MRIAQGLIDDNGTKYSTGLTKRVATNKLCGRCMCAATKVVEYDILHVYYTRLDFIMGPTRATSVAELRSGAKVTVWQLWA